MYSDACQLLITAYCKFTAESAMKRILAKLWGKSRVYRLFLTQGIQNFTVVQNCKILIP